MKFWRFLIVNADDFGLSPGVNRGVIEAHERGIVTSASMMTRQAAASEAASYGRDHPALDLGIHFEFGDWEYQNGSWVPRYALVSPDNPQAVTEEACRQLDLFRELLSRDPTHIDSHQHFHKREPFHSTLASFAAQLRVPLRGSAPHIHYCGAFYGQTAEGNPNREAITTEGLERILTALPAGTTELSCHPGLNVAPDNVYAIERGQEVMVLCDARIRVLIERLGIKLCSFADKNRDSAR